MPLSEHEALRVNIEGRALEKAGRIDEAIALYEYGVAGGTDTPATVERITCTGRVASLTLPVAACVRNSIRRSLSVSTVFDGAPVTEIDGRTA
jgi:hypothetical protein